MSTVYTWSPGPTKPIDTLREPHVEARVSAREPYEARVSLREPHVEARVSAREPYEARVSLREQAAVEAGVVQERRAEQVAARAEGSIAHRPSAEVPDWSREYCAPLEWNPSRQLLRALRDYTRARSRSGPLALAQRKAAALRHRFWSVITGAEIPLNSARIAGGLLIPHPNGIVVHPEVVIGPNCLLFQQVTLGTGPRPGLPKLGGNIDVGPGAKILGGVSIGDHAVIGANAVVLTDVAPGAVVVGVPAVPKKKLVMRQRDGQSV